MTRLTFLAVAAIVGGLSGCMTPARYVQKGTDQGIVAIPEWTNDWPTYYKDAAMKLITQHVGKDPEILDKFEVVTGPSSGPRMSSDPSNPTGSSSSTKTEYRIVYRKRIFPPAVPIGGPPAALGMRPLPPGAGLGAGPMVPAGGPMVPVGGPPMVPAGGPPPGAYVPGSLTGAGAYGGPTSPIVPSVGPPPGNYPYTPASPYRQ